MTPLSKKDFVFAAAVAVLWVAAWAALMHAVPDNIDAREYLKMAHGHSKDALPPFAYRVGAPWLAGHIPTTPENGLRLVTYAGVGFALFFSLWMGLRQGLSRQALLLSVVASGSLKGWAHLFHNPYLTDGAGLAWLSAGAFAWTLGVVPFAVAVALVGPMFRETVAVLWLLWLFPRRWIAAAVLLIASAAVVLFIQHAPGAPAPPGAFATFLTNMQQKGPVKIIGDIPAAYHALWLAAVLGYRAAPAARRAVWGPLLLVLLAAAFAMSAIGSNTIRFFTFALPAMWMAVAEYFLVLVRRSERLAWAVAAGVGIGGFLWFPMDPVGGFFSSHRWIPYVFCGLAVVAVGWSFDDRSNRAAGP